MSRTRAQLDLHLRDAVVLGAAAILLLLITDWVFGGVAELVSGALVVVVFVIAMRAAAVRGGTRRRESDAKRGGRAWLWRRERPLSGPSFCRADRPGDNADLFRERLG